MKKIIATTVSGKVIDEVKPKRKPPKPWIMPNWLRQYIYDRDMSILVKMFTSQETKDLINERIKDGYYENNI